MIDTDALQSFRRKLTNAIGLLILSLTFGWSIVHVFWQSYGVSGGVFGEDKKVITFVHWQLEGRTVDAMEWAAGEYMKLHPDVHIQQIAVPTSAYDQWVRTQLIGRTAPDLIEMWGREDWDNLAVRYFVPLPNDVEQPNPYNVGTDLEGVPWRETYNDRMRGGFRTALQEYYSVPLSMFTVRIYANKDLLEQVAAAEGTGPVAEPKTLGEFMALCRTIEAYSKRTGAKIVPIAGGESIVSQFRWKYFVMGTAGLLEQLDEDLDGDLLPGVVLEATMAGFDHDGDDPVQGKLNLRTDPALRTGHMVLYDICRFFNKGFMSAKRDQPISLFSQGKAAMIATGSWEAGSLYRQVSDDFEIVVYDFPVAGPNNEHYPGRLQTRVSEAGIQSGFPMGLTRFSKHRDVAIDFMRFLSSREMNEKLNRRFRWIPAIEGAEPDEVLRAFKPKLDGVYQAYLFPHIHPGTHLTLSYDQKLLAYLGQDDPIKSEYDQFLNECINDRDAFIDTHGALARRFLRRFGYDPASCTYERFRRIWRRQHYEDFIDSYASDYRRLAMTDFHRTWSDTYAAIHRSEAGLAAARSRAVQRGLSDRLDADIRRNLAALTHGQVTRIMQRADSKMRFERVEAYLESGGGGQ